MISPELTNPAMCPCEEALFAVPSQADPVEDVMVEWSELPP